MISKRASSRKPLLFEPILKQSKELGKAGRLAGEFPSCLARELRKVFAGKKRRRKKKGGESETHCSQRRDLHTSDSTLRLGRGPQWIISYDLYSTEAFFSGDACSSAVPLLLWLPSGWRGGRRMSDGPVRTLTLPCEKPHHGHWHPGISPKPLQVTTETC